MTQDFLSCSPKKVYHLFQAGNCIIWKYGFFRRLGAELLSECRAGVAACACRPYVCVCKLQNVRDGQWATLTAGW